MKLYPRLRVMLIALALLAPVTALVWWQSGSSVSWQDRSATPVPTNIAPTGTSDLSPVLSVGQPSGSTAPPPSSSLPPSSLPAVSPMPYSPSASEPLSSGSPYTSFPPANVLAADALLVPVAGVRLEDLRDTFTESRSGGRAHDAIDIIAPRGTPVLAVADGRIVKLFQSVLGGITIYQLATDNRTIYYYAHLDRYADGLAEGQTVRRGTTIAYVGDTGNSTPGNYHLHFSVSIVADPQRWWDGTNINPYPLFFNR